jgi:glycerol uptake facilitator-like aquaporin
MQDVRRGSAGQPSANLAQLPFAGRIGGNQDHILDPQNINDLSILKRLPDASPFISVKGIFSLGGFLERDLWKAAFIECLGTLLLVWLTVWISAHPPPASPPAPSPTSGIYSTPVFLGPLVGGITNIIIISLFIYCLGPVSGGHLNPIITLSTFTARLTSFPRMVLYISAQSLGATLAGLLLRACYGSRNFVTGGCTFDKGFVPTRDAFAIEFMADLTLLFLAFGVGLDPRQNEIFGPALAPVLVGMSVGIISFGTAITRPGYYGASTNPTRCLGAYVGSTFPTYGWIYWVAAVIAAIIHGGVYWAVPPWNYRKGEEKQQPPLDRNNEP